MLNINVTQANPRLTLTRLLPTRHPIILKCITSKRRLTPAFLLRIICLFA